MVLKSATRLVTFIPVKIADLQENDTTAHTEDISASVPPEVMAILVYANRISGTGNLRIYMGSGTAYCYISPSNSAIITIVNQELKWANSVNNDDWDIYLYGYVIRKKTR